jgi:hypothetical protein
MRHFLRKHFLSERDNVKFVYFIMLTFMLLIAAMVNSKKGLQFHMPFNNQIIDSQIKSDVIKSGQTLNSEGYEPNKL